MPTHPKISIVTPSYNQAAFVEEALLSVKTQNYPSIEHIVVDGASIDGTVDILKRYGSRSGWEHLRWISEPDHGQSDALNKGFRMATGEIVGWLNSDDRYRTNCFAHVASSFREMPATDILYGDHVWIDAAGNQLQVRKEIEFSLFVLAYHRVLYIPTTSTFFRRQIFEQGNYVDPRYQFAMDYEFFLRLALRGYRFQHTSRLLADFRWQDQSKTVRSAARQFEERDEILSRYAPSLSIVPKYLPFRLVRGALRIAAGARRYSEKAVRGYYFHQFRKKVGCVDQIAEPDVSNVSS